MFSAAATKPLPMLRAIMKLRVRFVGVYDVSCEADIHHLLHTQVKPISKSLKIMLPLLDFELLTFAEILVAPSSIEATLEPGEIDAFSLTISNP